MSDYDDLPPARKAAIRGDNARHHGSVVREIGFKLEDARSQAFSEAIAWLGANGFSKAAAALERQAFEPGEPI